MDLLKQRHHGTLKVRLTRSGAAASERCLCSLLLGAFPWSALSANADPAALALSQWIERFAREVDHRLDLPPQAQAAYIALLDQALANTQLPNLAAQAFVLVDRRPQVPAAFVVLRTPSGAWHWLGADAVSTGKTGGFEHFRTPLGVFAHPLDNPDFRAEGTLNQNHIRGHGLRGRRVVGFGWKMAERGWGAGGTSRMRLQKHATDPYVLEPRLGRPRPPRQHRPWHPG
jgi:hypothetical protein